MNIDPTILKNLSPSQLAELNALLVAPIRPNFHEWLLANFSTWEWDWPHLTYIQEALSRVSSGDLKKLMLFVPPRHGKSEMVTIRYSMYRLSCDPTMRVIVGAYNQMLSNKFSRKCRKIAYQVGIPVSRKRSAVEDWETEVGGGLRAVGVGGGITGQGGDLIVIDDPVKNREEAESELQRDKVYDWYTDDLYTRLEPGASIVLIMTRWHEDDLAGRILASEDGPNWEVISLPAEAEENDPLGREFGAALCPDRYDEEKLAQLKVILGLSYYALYQQRPQPKEGSMFKEDWFRQFTLPPSPNCWRIRYWDNAATEGDGDFTVGFLWALDLDGSFVIENIVRGQWSVEQRERMREHVAAEDYQKYGHKVEIWIEQEPGSSGKESVAASIKRLAGYKVYSEGITGDKIVRAEPFAAQAQAGNVKLVKGSWNGPFLSELMSFPFGLHDDQIDAASGGFNKLALKVRRPFTAAIGGERTIASEYAIATSRNSRPGKDPVADAIRRLR